MRVLLCSESLLQDTNLVCLHDLPSFGSSYLHGMGHVVVSGDIHWEVETINEKVDQEFVFLGNFPFVEEAE